jgi:hypothetical protein
MTEAQCHVCHRIKKVYTIRNGFRICSRCAAATAKNAFDALEHRATFDYVNKSLRELADSLREKLGAIELEQKIMADQIALLTAAMNIEAPKRKKSNEIRALLAENPNLTVAEIQAKTGFKADTIRKVRSARRSGKGQYKARIALRLPSRSPKPHN